LEVLVKLNDDRTTISINENIEGKMLLKKIGILTPGIASVAPINLYKLDKHKMKDYVITYLYVRKNDIIFFNLIKFNFLK